MKKLVMTGLLAAMACGVQAATLYEKNGTKVDMKGDMQIQIRQKVGVDQDPYFDYDDLTVGFYAEHKNDAEVTAFSHLKMDWKKQADGSAKAAVDEASVGVAYGPVKVHIGRIDWGSDSFYACESIEIGADVIAAPEVAGYETIQAILDMGLADLVLSTDMEVEDNSSVAEAFLVTNPKKFNGLKLGALFQSFQPETEAGEEKPDTVDTVGVCVGYSIGKISLGADYTTNDDMDVMNVCAKAKLPANSSIGVGYVMESPDEDDEVGTWYSNVKHSLNKYSTVFAEVGGNDEDNTDIGYLVGMKVKF
jgi:predicted porin